MRRSEPRRRRVLVGAGSLGRQDDPQRHVQQHLWTGQQARGDEQHANQRGRDVEPARKTGADAGDDPTARPDERARVRHRSSVLAPPGMREPRHPDAVVHRRVRENPPMSMATASPSPRRRSRETRHAPGRERGRGKRLLDGLGRRLIPLVDHCPARLPAAGRPPWRARPRRALGPSRFGARSGAAAAIGSRRRCRLYQR